MKIQVNNIGVEIVVAFVNPGDNDAPVSVVDAILKSIIFRRPDNSKFAHSANFVTDGSDGKIFCLTVEGDLNQRGRYFAQGYIETETQKLYSLPVYFDVRENL